jgi:hypothetical protein
MISLDSGIFGEGLPMQELFETVLDRPVGLISQQDNASVIQIIHGGYSPKFRYMKKVHKLNLSSLYEIFEDSYVILQYIKIDLQRADPFRKAFEPCKWNAVLELMYIKPL